MSLPLPTLEEVLICNSATTTEEVRKCTLRPHSQRNFILTPDLPHAQIKLASWPHTFQVTLLWRRAIGDPGFKRIFCLLHAEKLSYQICDQALQSLTELSHGRKQSESNILLARTMNIQPTPFSFLLAHCTPTLSPLPPPSLSLFSPPSCPFSPSLWILPLLLIPFLLSLPLTSHSPSCLFCVLPPLFCPYSTTDYRLVIICSSKDEDKSHIISQLSPHKKHFAGLHDVAKYREYLKIHFTRTTPFQSLNVRFAGQGIHASIIDSERYV